MADITVDFHRSLGKIRPMHAVGQPPFGAGIRKLDFRPCSFSLMRISLTHAFTA